MTESTSEQNAAATVAAKDTNEKTAERRDAEAFARQKLSSTVVVINEAGEFINAQPDGEFDLNIDDTSGAVIGTHTRPTSPPTSNEVTGHLTAGVIHLIATGESRRHVGILFGNRFIGTRKSTGVVLFGQEEGVWVGTKVP
jgi:hypothetical protein